MSTSSAHNVQTGQHSCMQEGSHGQAIDNSVNIVQLMVVLPHSYGGVGHRSTALPNPPNAHSSKSVCRAHQSEIAVLQCRKLAQRILSAANATVSQVLRV